MSTEVTTTAIGAFDRFNYGDLLFPIIVERFSPNTTQYFSLSSINESAWGSVAVDAYSYDNHPDQRVLVAGGDALAATWFGAHWQLHDQSHDLYFKLLYRLFPEGILDSFVRKAYRSEWITPYLPNTGWFKENNRVSYNAVGCSDLLKRSKSMLVAFQASLNHADYLSVRDKISLQALKSIGIKAVLAPDSVASVAKNSLAPSSKSGTALFQCSAHWLKNNSVLAINTVKALHEHFGSVHFLPIGIAGGHSDLSAGYKLKKQFAELHILDVSSVQDIYSQISGAEFFVGSSLHGHITAIAEATPCATLPGVSKLTAYRETWTDLCSVELDSNNLRESIVAGTKVDHSRMDEVRFRCADLAEKNTKNALEALM